MADEIVKRIVEKLGAAIIKEGELLWGIRDDLEFIKDELATMKAFLEEAEGTGEIAKIKREWIKRVRELAYDAEDCIDEFQQHLADPPSHELRRRLRVALRVVRTLKARHLLAMEIPRIKAGVLEASDRAQRYGFISTGYASSSAPGASGDLSQHPFRLNALFIQEADLVGIDKPRNKLLDLMMKADKSQRSVFSVVGCGGLGKTTLVKRVFESQRLRSGLCLDCHAWITVSESFNTMGFIKTLCQKLFTEEECEKLFQDNSDTGMNEVIEHIRGYLHDKRYVIVLDDVWEVSAWESIKLALPENNRGSKIIVTTRDDDVARACCSPNPEYVFRMQPHSPQDSEDLFCRKVFGGRSCPDHLKEPTQLLLRKCGGLPLAVVTIGGVVAHRPTQNIDDLNFMLYHLGSELEDNKSLEGMVQIMSLSYKALPYHLKRCFLYLSIFPEDYEIDSKRLQRLWIAEGMVERRRDMTPEKVAQSYFHELISRSLHQPCEISDRGAVKRCRLHDILLEFAISKSTEENMVTVYNQHNRPMQHGVIRRLSLLYQREDDVVITRPDRLRSVVLFSYKWPPLPGQPFQKFKLLRVLDLSDAKLGTDFPSYISKLYHLKYLNLRDAFFYPATDDLVCLGELRNLEMLDVRGSGFIIPSQAVGKLNKLRYLKADVFWAAPGLWGWNDLQVLEGVEFVADYNSMAIAQELRNLNQLRKLGLHVTRDTIMSCCAFISEISRSLRSLEVSIIRFEDSMVHQLDSIAEDSMVHQLDSLASPPLFLRSLKLSNYEGNLPGWIKLLKNVSKIVLGDANLHAENVGALQQLPNLITLKLSFDCGANEELHFSGGGFPRLKSLTLYHLSDLKALAFADGSMPRLEVLRVYYCHGLERVSPFVHENLPSLKEVVVILSTNDFRGHSDEALREAAEAHPNNPKYTTIWEETRRRRHVRPRIRRGAGNQYPKRGAIMERIFGELRASIDILRTS